LNTHPPESSTPHRRAVIDVGTNSVKVLLGDVRPGGIEPVWETSDQTRLGEGFYASHRLKPEAVARTASSVARLAQEARRRGAARIEVLATSAAREALNGQDLVTAITDASGLITRIISGDQEALWAYHGIATDPALAGHPLLIVDAGGGSTEFVLGSGEDLLFRKSYPLGTVRMLDRCPVSNPPTAAEWQGCRSAIGRVLEQEMLPEIHPHLDRVSPGGWSLVAASGTATVLARIERKTDTYDRALLDGVVVSADRLRSLREHLWTLSLSDRRRIAGLPPERADVILTGLAIYEGVLTLLRSSELRVSLRGIRFGALAAL
jgi:exopolyphosphatase/guanosine-5'-triphosphate,3'-diphosphate pyrophosphatase